MTPSILVLERSTELADQIRDVAEELPGAPEVVVCTRVGSATHVQEHDGPFAVVVAGPSLATRAGLRRLAGLSAEMPGTSFVIAIENRPDASLREIVQVGAVDLLELPADDGYVKGILRRALDRAAPSLEPVSHPSESAHAAKLITVCSATGGCGKTFFATNLATFLSTYSDARVVLVDLDLQFGEISTALRLQPPYTIVDAVQGDPEAERPADLAEHIEDYLVRFKDSFWTLAAPREPSQADDITAIDSNRVLEALRARFDYVIVDTPTALAETVLGALDISDHLYVLATLDLPAVRNLGVFLQTLQQLRIPEENVSLVLNKVEHDVGIDVSQLKRLFPQGFRATLPYSRDVSRSLNSGVPVLMGMPDAQISRRLAEGAIELLPEDKRSAARSQITHPVAAPGLFARFLRRRAPVATGGVQ